MIRFLVPVNFAPYTYNAIDYSIALAEHLQGEITLLYCYTHLLSEDENGNNEDTILSRDEAMVQLQKLTEYIIRNSKDPYSIIVRVHVIEGYAEDAIHVFSEDYKPDLIVMGTKSKGETIKELLGSVTLDVINKVSSPVLAVPNNYKFNIEKITNILFITDFEKCEYTSLHKLVKLVGAFETSIHSVQYCAGGKDKLDAENLKDYVEYCKSTYRNQEMACDYIYGNDIIEASKEYIHNNQIDLMAITRKKRNFISKMIHPSVTKRILFNAEIPTLFFHP